MIGFGRDTSNKWRQCVGNTEKGKRFVNIHQNNIIEYGNFMKSYCSQYSAIVGGGMHLKVCITICQKS